jgi:orotidine-5'-phosphate decarboxylase
MEKKTGLILALDVADFNEALRIAGDVERYVDAVKVGYPLILSAGIEIIPKLAGIKPVIADFKIADVPHVSARIAEIAYNSGSSAVVVHGFAGSDTIKAILEVAGKHRGEVYVVTELSSKAEFSISSRIVEIAKKLGCNGIVAPATRAEKVSELRKIAGSLKILSPGIGAQGGEVEKVVKAGADFLVVGRSIYLAESPKNAAKELAERIKLIKFSK